MRHIFVERRSADLRRWFGPAVMSSDPGAGAWSACAACVSPVGSLRECGTPRGREPGLSAPRTGIPHHAPIHRSDPQVGRPGLNRRVEARPTHAGEVPVVERRDQCPKLLYTTEFQTGAAGRCVPKQPTTVFVWLADVYKGVRLFTPAARVCSAPEFWCFGSQRPRIHEQKNSKVSNGLIRYVKQTEILTHATYVNGCFQAFTWVARIKISVCLTYRIYPFETFEFFCSCIRGQRREMTAALLWPTPLRVYLALEIVESFLRN